MTFAWPWAFLGLLALPVLAAIYWLRQRARRRPVSSLLLWRDAPQSRASGRRFERFEASRLFVLELLILTLLVVAAAGPRLPGRQARRPLVVVLDDSFSMLAGAGGGPTAQERAREALLRELEDGRHGMVTLVTAGERPQVLGDGGSSPDGVAERLELWRALAPSSRLESAIALAGDLGGGRARLLVLSDRAPPEPPAPGRLAWWAFGRGSANLALVGAMRRPEGRGEADDAFLVEVANYSSRPAVARLSVVAGGRAGSMQADESVPLEGSKIGLAPGEVGRVRFASPRSAEVTLRLDGDDALNLDDQVLLLPERSRGVRVALQMADPDLRQMIRGVLAASERAIFNPDRAELVITDGAVAQDSAPTSSTAWRLRLVPGSKAKPYLGPFVLDRGHPLTDGLGLDGVIWAADATSGEAVGEPVITAGDVTLLADRELAGGRHALTFYWRSDLSTLQRTPNWPILWWNLLEWRAQSLPGVRAVNLRLGGEATIGLAMGSVHGKSAQDEAELELPDGSRRMLAARGGSLSIAAEALGIHRLRHGGRSDRWVVNALAAEESDLRGTVSGRWGAWRDGPEERWQSRGVAWAFLLLAAAGWVLHLFWTGKR